MHLVAALVLTALMAGGLAGLGELFGGRSAADRWVRGWMVTWWVVALTAEAASPRAAVALGFALLAVGLSKVPRIIRGDLATVLLFGAGLLAGAPLWLVPPYFYDTLVYHLGLPWSWLANGSFATAPHNVFSHFPLAGQTVFLLPVAVGVEEAAAGLHWTTLLVALAAMARCARTLGAGRWRWVAPSLLLACWHVTWISTVAAVDMLVVVAVLAMAEHVVGTDEGEGSRALGVGSGLGLALSLKYTAMIPAAAVLAAAVITFPVAVAGAVAIGAASSSFWWLRNLATTGNPVFPLLWSVFGGRGWSAADDQRYAALVREGVSGLPSLPHGVLHLLKPPDGLGWWVLVAVPLVALALLARSGRRRARGRIALASALMLTGWLVTSQTTRYALPLAALVAVLAAVGLGELGRGAAGVAAGALGVAALHGTLGLGGFVFGVLGFDRAWTDVEGWRHRVTINDPLPAYRRCDAVLPTEARILVVGEGRPWGCPRAHHVSSPYDRQLVQALAEGAPSAAEIVDRLRSAGFTHLLINWGEVGRLGGPDFRVLRFETSDAGARWRKLLSVFTTPVFREGPIEVRALLRGLGEAANRDRDLAHAAHESVRKVARPLTISRNEPPRIVQARLPR